MSKAEKPGKLLPLDAARYLTNDAAVAEYMTAILKTDDPDLPLLAPGDAARARGLAQVPKTQGWGAKACTRLSLLAQKPRFDTVLKLARPLGVRLAARPA